MKLRVIVVRRVGNPTLVGVEEEAGFGELPAVVHPEPIFWLAAHHLLDTAIHPGGESFDGLFGLMAVHRGTANHTPAAGAIIINGHRHQDATGAVGHHGRNGCGGGQAVKEGRPNAVVTRMLIHQDPQATALFHVFHRPCEAVLTVKKGVAELAAAADEQGVEERIAERLVNGGGFTAKNEEGGNLGEDLPAAQVADEVEDGLVLRHGLLRVVHAFHGDALFHFSLGHHGELESAQDVGNEGLKVSFRGVVDPVFPAFAPEGDAEIVLGQLSVFGKDIEADGAE